MQDKKAKYDFSKWDRDLVSSTVENGNLLKALIGRGVDIEEIRKYLTGPLRTPMNWPVGKRERSPKEKDVKKGYEYGIRYLKNLLSDNPDGLTLKPWQLMKDKERNAIERILHRFEEMFALFNEDSKTTRKRVFEQINIDPRLKTKNQREGMIIYNLHAILNPIALRMSYTQQDTFSLIAELLNITNHEIKPTNIYDSGQVKVLYSNILKFT